MPTWLRWTLDNLLPLLVEDPKSKRVLHWVFWPATALMGLLFIPTNGLFGLFMVGVPLLLAGATLLIGLARVPVFLLVLAGVAVMFPAFFLNLFERGDGPSNAVGYVVIVLFIAWLATYPTMIGTLNQHYLERAYPGEDLGRDEFAIVRVTAIKLWIAAVTMQLVGDELAAVVSVIALWHRRAWSAAAAGLVCLLSPLFWHSGAVFAFEFDPLATAAGVFAALPWFQAARLPLWDKRHVWV